MKRLISILLMGAMVLTACGAEGPGGNSGSGQADSGQKVTLKIGNSQVDTHPWNEAIQVMTEKAAEYSGGQLEIVNYPNATLGAENDMLESVREGSLDMCVVDPTVGTTFCKQLELFSLPFIFRDKEHWAKVLDGEIGEGFKALIDEKGNGIKILDFWGGSERNILAVKKAVASIDDLQGFKLRLAPSDLKFKVWESVGALPVAIAFGETYSALASGLCDGMENEMPSILASKFYEPAPYFTMTGHEITVRPLFVNKDKYDSLSPELKEALDKAVADATKVAREKEAEAAAEAEKEMVEKYGVIETQIDKTPIMEKTKPIFDEFGQQNDLSEIIEEIVTCE